MTENGSLDPDARLLDVLRRVWGYDAFRPLQREAMHAVLNERDSVVVLPTGGGKSLCYQTPALCCEGLAVVVSPLISLMKDQVDALLACGVAAACINSSLSPDERRQVADDVGSGDLKLLYLAPERLMTERTLEFLKQARVSFVAIDEAHCISQWGHDFRPEYRQLRILKDELPGIAIHAYTATATEQVRGDIVDQLGLTDPEVLVGSFDRPNLTYKVSRRGHRLTQICEILQRHRGETGIVYCISRKDVESIAQDLNANGYSALPYHAGLEDEERRRNQEAFIREDVDTIVATVAFGMGIDKSNVRYVIHAGMPKSLENYQQESGRAGRDGLEAECHLLYTGGDFGLWKSMLRDLEGDAYNAALESLQAMYDFCSGVTCRHRTLVQYFGQDLEKERCDACDVCLGDLDLVDDALVIGQKILSCVVRLDQRFGGDYTAKVLKGSQERRILDQGHDQLSTYGLLAEHDPKTIRDWIEQLAAQGFLNKAGEYNVLQVTEAGRQLLRGEAEPRLLKPTKKKRASRSRAASAADAWEGVDEGLFEALRELRKEKARTSGIPAYMVFDDAALRDMARRRPTSTVAFLEVKGVGHKKCGDYGEEFVEFIAGYCERRDLETDIDGDAPAETPVLRPSRGPSQAAVRAGEMFAEGKSVAEVVAALERAESTVRGFLGDYLREQQITDPTPWVVPGVVQRVEAAAAENGLDRLTPIHEDLGGTVSYEDIRIVIECLRNRIQQQNPNP